MCLWLFRSLPIYHRGKEAKIDHIRPMRISDHKDAIFRVKVHGPHLVAHFKGTPIIAWYGDRRTNTQKEYVKVKLQ